MRGPEFDAYGLIFGLLALIGVAVLIAWLVKG